MSNSYIKEDLLAQARTVTTKVYLRTVPRVNVVDRTRTSRLRDFVRMNPPKFLCSKVRDNPQDFLDGVYKVLSTMRVTSIDKAELAMHQLREVTQFWYTQWKDNRLVEYAPIE